MMKDNKHLIINSLFSGIIVLAVFPLFIHGCRTESINPPFKDNYNIVWDSQSKNSSESMPVVGGDMACNVWVENGELLFYISRSGSFDEHGTYLKLGRVRVKLSPDPFEGTGSFRQELKLHDGFVEIRGQAEDHSLNAKIRVWVDVHKPVVHDEVDASQPIEIDFNPDYIADVLRVLDTDDIVLELKDGECAGMIREGKTYTYVVMPLSA